MNNLERLLGNKSIEVEKPKAKPVSQQKNDDDFDFSIDFYDYAFCKRGFNVRLLAPELWLGNKSKNRLSTKIAERYLFPDIDIDKEIEEFKESL